MWKCSATQWAVSQTLLHMVCLGCFALTCTYLSFGYIDENKAKIAKSDALRLLVDLARSKDQRVQRNATGALLNMTHTRKRILSNVMMVPFTD